ncbi:antibiotic biosynthesis monooxygenase [Roseibaca sp. Y0-43]|uniref:antibiotic biosynthesis monooxygenase n=1 Tax=Roseibaca sp. Y0-43 TaxID=2816854 RepID=UPI001D0C6F2A|nr:antibiotic biosynthesis monooxygenase [Roseibaca sp. Y0-43]MCC1482256.1 antibiotic biosynthesis monooxygenase [Roseibaca sp. Y0-43]
MSKITRIYRVRIHPHLRAEFEPLFKTVARASVADVAGCVGVTVGFPTQASPDEYAMISVWKSAGSLTAFIGPNWDRVHIPDSMAHFFESAWVHHFTHADGPDA